MWQRERLYNGSTGGSIIAAENQERAPRNCIAVACETPSWQHENARHSGRLYPTRRRFISRRHERDCVVDGSGGAYHGVTRDSLRLMQAGEPVNGGTSDSISIMPRGDTVSRWQESLHVQRGIRPCCWLVPCATARESPLLS